MSFRILFIAIVCFSVEFTFCDEKSFHNQRLYAVKLRNNETVVEELQKLRYLPFIDFWNHPSKTAEKVLFRVPPEYHAKMDKYLKENYIEYDILTEDIQLWIDRERQENNITDTVLEGRVDVKDFQINQYHQYPEIMSFLDQVGREYPNIASTVEIGKTYEGNAIKGIKIGSKGNQQKPIFWIDGGIHAREWVSPATVIYVIHLFATNYGKDQTITQLVDKYDWHIFPLLNPDGYKYTFTRNSGSRMWRKNRSVSRRAQTTPENPWDQLPWGPEWGQQWGQEWNVPLPAELQATQCRISTDLNRNFPVGFGGASTSRDKCSDQFHGDSALSELETKAVTNKILSLKPKVVLTLHAFSQLWMIPYGYRNAKTRDHAELNGILAAAVSAVQSKHGQRYKYGTISETIYPAGGSSIDWVYDNGIKYSELRDTGTYGFMLPPHLILPTAEETFEAIKVIAQRAK